MPAPPKRHVRPELDRQGPTRAFNRVWGRPADPGMPAAGRATGDAARPIHPAARGVELGYRVIEEYMREGQAFARRARPGGADDALPVTDPRRLTDRLFQNAADFSAAWLEYAQTVMAQVPWTSPAPPAAPPTSSPIGGFDLDGGPPPAKVHAAGPVPATARSAARAPEREPIAWAASPTVTLDVVSKRRTEVTVEMKPGASVGPLVAHDLRPASLDQPRIGGVRIEPDPANDRIVVRIAVGDDCAPGTYTGLVVDGVTNLPRGSIAVRVLESTPA